MSSEVPNLRSYSFSVPAGEVLVLAADKHRRAFAVDPLYPASNPNQVDVRIWWGPLGPPVDKAKWRQLPADGLSAPAGIYGPIYIADVGNQQTELFISSAASEENNATLVEGVTTFAITAYLTDEGGNRLVTETGDHLIAYL